ncbi:unnamed protein product [Mytilus coruscus]|uniref:Uncharacterized protein n=1 Tax=Mytilus coruscus TaxID=42192 RepID=A0A6J8D4V0_MYTCO|nr:unnamed protein product [Mytilus coruscus]
MLRAEKRKGAVGEINTEKDKETASEEERDAFFRSKELDILTATMNKQSDEAENQNVQTEQKIINKESLLNQGENRGTRNRTHSYTRKEENASEEERLAFFQSVRDVERQKLVEAFDREQIWKEESQKKRMTRKQEKIKKMFEEFHIPAVSAYPASYSSHEQEQEPGPFNANYHKLIESLSIYLLCSIQATVIQSTTYYLKHSVSRLHERVQTFVKEQKELQQHIEQTHSKKHRADLEENKGNGHINIRTRMDAEILVDRINEVKRKGSVRRFVNRIFKRSQSMLRIKQVDTEEMKPDVTLLGDNKDEDNEEEGNNLRHTTN